MTDVHVGDEVTVTLKGTVNYVYADAWHGNSTFDIQTAGVLIEDLPLDDEDVTIEVHIKPKGFKAGTVIQHRRVSSIYTVLDDNKLFVHSAGRVEDNDPDYVTTENYEVIAGPGVED